MTSLYDEISRAEANKFPSKLNRTVESAIKAGLNSLDKGLAGLPYAAEMQAQNAIDPNDMAGRMSDTRTPGYALFPHLFFLSSLLFPFL